MCTRRSPVSSLQLFGYGIAFLGVCWYNYQKFQSMKPAQQQPTTPSKDDLPGERETLIGHHQGRT